MRNKQKQPAKFVKGMPAHKEQITSNGWVIHDTKGWRKIRSGNTARGRKKIDAFIAMAIQK